MLGAETNQVLYAKRNMGEKQGSQGGIERVLIGKKLNVYRERILQRNIGEWKIQGKVGHFVLGEDCLLQSLGIVDAFVGQQYQSKKGT